MAWILFVAVLVVTLLQFESPDTGSITRRRSIDELDLTSSHRKFIRTSSLNFIRYAVLLILGLVSSCPSIGWCPPPQNAARPTLSADLDSRPRIGRSLQIVVGDFGALQLVHSNTIVIVIFSAIGTPLSSTLVRLRLRPPEWWGAMCGSCAAGDLDAPLPGSRRSGLCDLPETGLAGHLSAFDRTDLSQATVLYLPDSPVLPHHPQ